MVENTISRILKNQEERRELTEILRHDSSMIVDMAALQCEYAKKLQTQTEVLSTTEKVLEAPGAALLEFEGRGRHDWWCEPRQNPRDNSIREEMAPADVVRNSLLIEKLIALSERIKSVGLIAKAAHSELEKAESRKEKLLQKR